MPANRPDRFVYAGSLLRCLQTVWRLLPVLLVVGCQQAYGPGSRSFVEIGADGWKRMTPQRYYPPPGPAEDPWGPYIREAAARYRVPEQWVRAVMHQESGGQEQATSPVGAMGLMQVMPPTYDELRVRHRLGDDPYDPHNNILAGTAYIREMYDRYGSPGFLAAYNAGPDRVDSYLAGRSGLPDETVNYLASITPNLGTGVPRSGPFAVYASARSGQPTRFAPTVASLAAGCDVNAAYNPNRPCTSLERAATQPAPIQTASVPQLGANGCDLNAAYNPNHPCTASTQTAAVLPASSSQQIASAGCDPNAAYNPNRPCAPGAQPAASGVKLASAGCDPDAAFDPQCGLAGPRAPRPLAAVAPAALRQPASRPPLGHAAVPAHAAVSQPGSAGGGWGIQVGAFANPGLARAVAETARAQAPDQLRSATLTLPPTPPLGHTVLYRARLVNLSPNAASSACARLNHRQLPCVVVRPAGA